MIAAAAPERSTCPTCGGIFRGRLAHCFQDGTALVPVAGDPLIGRVLKGGRYRIRRALGEGSAGRVYEGQDLVTGVSVAIKVLFGELVAMVEVRERFRREAEAAGRLVHPNIASVIDAGLDEPNEPMYLIMPHVAGRTLAERVATDGPLAPDRVQTLLAGLASALAHAHAHGVLHRDVKPDNVIIEDEAGTPKLIDFGVSKLSIVRANRKLTSYGRVLGTPGFVAPEILRGEEAGERSDLYGLGVTGYYALAGRLPFSDGEMASVAETLAGIDIGPVDELAPGRLAFSIRRLVALDPAGRPATACDAHAMLSAPLALIGSEPDNDHETSREPVQASWRRRTVMAVGATAMAVIGLAIAWTAVDGAGPSAGGEPARALAPVAPAPSPALLAPRARFGAPPNAAGPPPSASPAVPVSAARAPSSSPHKTTAPRRPAKAQRPIRRRTSAGHRSSPTPRSTSRVGSEPQRRGSRNKNAPAAATPRALMRAYSELGRRLESVAATPGAAPLQQRYFDLPIADALQRRSQMVDVMRRIDALAADVAALEAQGTSPLRP